MSPVGNGADPKISGARTPVQNLRSALQTHLPNRLSILSPRELEAAVRNVASGSKDDGRACEEAAKLVKIIKDFLEYKEGSALKAWLRHFDPTGVRGISQKLFLNGLRKLSFAANQADIKEAFSIVDKSNAGELSLKDFDSGQAEIWRHFSEWCFMTFEAPEDMLSMLTLATSQCDSGIAPRKPEDPESNVIGDAADKTLSRQGFCDGLRTLGFTETTLDDLDLICKALDITDEEPVAVDNLEWLLAEKKAQNVQEMAKSRRQGAQLSPQAIENRKRQQAAQEFRKYLRHKYGNFVRGWRRLLSSGSLVLRRHELIKACASVGWPGDVKRLCQALDKDGNGFISIEELDAKGAESLAYFHKFVMDTFGDAATAFRKLDKRNTRKLRLSDFLEGLQEFGYHLPGKSIFQSLDLEGHKAVFMEDLAILQSWKPPAYLAASANNAAVDELKMKLIAKYRNMVKAWRHCLDPDSSNRCNWEEFESACERVGFTGDAAGAWRALDEDLSGYITLREIDESANEILWNFKCWADEQFGGVRKAFAAFDSDHGGEVSYREFRRACRDYGLDLDFKALFFALDVEGSDSLSMDEVKFLDEWDFADGDDDNDPVQGSEMEGSGSPARKVQRTFAPSDLTQYETLGPGPGAYETALPTIGNGPNLPMLRFQGACSFGKRFEPLSPGRSDGGVPSPSEYSIHTGAALGLPAHPNWSFAKGKWAVAEPQGPASVTPGPGEYTVHSKDGVHSAHSPQITCSPRRKLRLHPLYRGLPSPRAVPNVPDIPSYAANLRR